MKEKKKRRQKIFAVLTAAAFVFVLAGCIHYGSGDDNIGHFGNTLEITEEPVVTADRASVSIVYEPFEGNNLEVFFDETIVGEITDGELDLRITTPDNLAGGNWDWLERTNVRVIPAETQYARLILDTSEGKLFRGYEIGDGTASNGSKTVDRVEFIYVDRDVNLRAEHRTLENTGNGRIYTYRDNHFNLTLRAGWNAMHIRVSTNWTATHLTRIHDVVSRGNPANLNWILEESEELEDKTL